MTEDAAIEARVKAALGKLDATYEWIEIDPAFADTTQFCAQYGFDLDRCGNTIIVASKKQPKQYAACVVKGSRRLDVNRTVRKLMGVRKASFASSEETRERTGMLIGGVTPFDLPDDIPVYIDATLMDLDYVILGSGSRSSKIKAWPSLLGKIPNAQIVEGLSLEPRPES